MKRLLLMACMLLAGGLAGAVDKPGDKVGESISSEIEPWTVAPAQYTCTSEQWVKLEYEHSFCIANTDHTKEYCYGTAFIRNCSKRTGRAPAG